ncbi:high affinity cAMP-specific and IBMX-insensitive 3',5'-cyclic phosphodiesterase 8 isoform X2 [Chelonus insularis]|uniref:high affinity cAMP-specific and IBMX-insensitive 3',5'-cyclic phosphodiesterase 8 isoform X2 n=2 Tax=Chelonus insularis TaxID=460826 RepID=UPI00158DAB20|nr:high affinity cAMP-specific and IBMX-insensitive 3',5'-cyclic phosphodiesterase 8 isoform X2 [Chelonus insularis]XP_034944710.1 high affinity cAMP-specific and IBMX-insensitive 3',5'-cyclic phosphodiesterase 8 isoform X2 [Chelonus insularis]
MGCSLSGIFTRIKYKKKLEAEQGLMLKSDNGDLVKMHELDFWKEKSFVGSPIFLGDDDMEHSTAKGPQDFNSTLSITTPSQVVKVLLVFPRDDQQLEVLSTVIRKLGWSVSIAKNAEKAAELFQNRCHDLVIIDRRGHRASDGDTVCRAIQATNYHHSSVILALVKKSLFTISDNDEIGTLDLLNIGYSRAMMECSHEVMLSNQLIGIYASEIQPRMQLAAAHALYVAVDRCRDMVHVTDDQHVVRFVNKASERLLGYKYDEMLGRNLSEIINCENFVLMDQQLQRGREFEGNMNCRRKYNDTITINCRIVPFCASGKKPTHYVYVHDTMYLLENMGSSGITLGGHPRGSLHSLRRGSFDVKSVGSDIGTQRRSSLQKLNNLPLEAPITKVMTLLTNAMTEIAGINPEMAMQIDKAIETLKTTELYRPYLKEDTKIYNDPVASDLVEALLSKNCYYIRDSRRSSNDSTRSVAMRIGHSIAPRIQIKNSEGPKEIEELLDRSLDWDFDIFSLEVLSERRPLVHLGMNIMCRYQVPARLNCDETTLHNWLAVIEYKYHLENSYHNSTHAADVLQATARFMQSERLQMVLEPLDEVAALIAAAAHDVDHPGKSSQFLCNSDNKLAVLYNDLSVLESHHAAMTFKLTLADDSVNIFKNLERETYRVIRQNIIDMILATEMTKHFENLAKFVNVCSDRGSDEYFEGPDMATILQPENVTLIKIMMIKCADVSNPTRPLRCCIEWAKRIAEEYFSQTDEEKKRKMPVVMPMFDRNTCSIPKSQIGFVDYIINDMIVAWDAFIDMPELVTHMKHNYEKWKEYHEKGISTINDIERIQSSPELKIPAVSDPR